MTANDQETGKLARECADALHDAVTEAEHTGQGCDYAPVIEPILARAFEKAEADLAAARAEIETLKTAARDRIIAGRRYIAEAEQARAEATRYASERDYYMAAFEAAIKAKVSEREIGYTARKALDDARDDRSRYHARWLAASRALDEARGLLADASGAMADLLRASMNRTEFHGGTRHEYWIGWQDGDSVDPTELKNQARAFLEAMIAFDAAHPAPEVAPDAAQAVRPARTCK